MEILVRAHSGLRYVVLILILLAIYKAFTAKDKPFTDGDRKIALFAMISCHVQLLIGLILYFGNNWYSPPEGFMKVTMFRFFALEHLVAMILAIALITIGHSKSKKAESDKKKFKSIAVYYTIGLIVILASIPWPFRESLARGWF